MRVAAAFVLALSLLAASFASPARAQSRAAEAPPDPAAIQRRSEAAADTPDKAEALAERGKLLWQSDPDAALRYAREGLALAERLRDDHARASNLNVTGVVHYLRGDYDVARPLLGQAIALYEATGDARSAGRTAANLAHLESASNRYDEARRGYDRAEAFGRQANDDAGLATAKDGLGNLLQAQGRYREAIAAFEASLAHAERAGDEQSRAITLNNLANCRLEAGDTQAALAGYLEAAERFEKLNLPLFQSQAYANIAPILASQGMVDRARGYLERALAIQRRAGQRPAEGVTLLNLGSLLNDAGDTAGAIGFYAQARALFRELGDTRSEALALHNLGRARLDLGRTTEAVRDLTDALAIRQAVPDPRGALSSRIALAQAMTASDRARDAIPLLEGAIAEAKQLGVAELEAESASALADALRAVGRYREAYDRLAHFIDLRAKLLSESSQASIAEMQARFESERAERAIEVLKRDGEIQSLELQRQALLRNLLYASIAVLVLLAAVIASRYRLKIRSEAALQAKNVELEHARGELQVERDKSEKLLLNVLPPSIAGRLKDDVATIADHHPEATVLFADIVGFTRLAQAMDADALLELLNDLFTRFDALTDARGLEKIKTIGDCYMAVGGAPGARADHCEAVAELALDMLDEVGRFNAGPGRALALRIGMHSGEVVAGVIGRRKFAYDLWGDAVNTASRMESHGEPGRIHVTEAVATRLAGRYRFEPRGEIDVKGKGPMRTYFLVGRVDPTA
jgi:class 3 adenylate cyclase